MSGTHTKSTNDRLYATLLGAVAGAATGLLIGVVAFLLAPENGFGDLAAAAVTRVFLLPAGTLIGAAIGWFKTR